MILPCGVAKDLPYTFRFECMENVRHCVWDAVNSFVVVFGRRCQTASRWLRAMRIIQSNCFDHPVCLYLYVFRCVRVYMDGYCWSGLYLCRVLPCGATCIARHVIALPPPLLLLVHVFYFSDPVFIVVCCPFLFGLFACKQRICNDHTYVYIGNGCKWMLYITYCVFKWPYAVRRSNWCSYSTGFVLCTQIIDTW